jgi:tape measure domain-containing protein
MASKVKTQLVIEGKNNSQKAFDEVNKSLGTMNGQLEKAGKALLAAFSVSALTSAVRGIAAATDSYNLMNARLKLATDSQEEFNKAQTELRKIATATQTPLASLATLYGRISRPLKEAGRSQEDILKVTEAVATAFRVSGSSAQEAENGVIQFAQALGAGALRGDEFNSVAEQAPRLMRALADSLNVPIGALKEMAKQGLLTADVVTDALTSQLEVLRKEAESLPQTVGGAMTALSDTFNEAIGQADVQPLIDAINTLGDTISDPNTRDSLVLLAGALVQVAEAAIKAGAGTVSLAQDLGYIAARVTGNVTEIDRAAKELEKFEAAAQGFGMLDLFMTDEQINKGLTEWRAYYAALTEEQSGMNSEMEFLLDVAAAVADAARQKEIDARNQYLGELKRLQEQEVKAAEKQSKALVSAQKKANADLEKIRKERSDIEKRYSSAIAELGGTGDASFGAAQDLKVGAKAALKAGDFEGAQTQARAALKTLQDLAAAGENTYGFEGFIKELQAIDLAANDIEQTRAEDKIAAIGISIATLAADAAKLKDMQVSFKADDASIEAVRAQIQKLASDLGNTEIVIPVRVAAPGGDITPPQQFATGGHVRGPGSGTSDSIPALLSNGEYVIRAAAVRKLGKGYLDLINNGIPMRRFADGGMVESVAAMTAPGADNRVPANLYINGDKEPVSVMVNQDSFDRLLRRTAMKHGG